MACHTSWVSRNCVRTLSMHFACADSDPSYTDAQCTDTTGLIQIPQVWMQKRHDLGVARKKGLRRGAGLHCSALLLCQIGSLH